MDNKCLFKYEASLNHPLFVASNKKGNKIAFIACVIFTIILLPLFVVSLILKLGLAYYIIFGVLAGLFAVLAILSFVNKDKVNPKNDNVYEVFEFNEETLVITKEDKERDKVKKLENCLYVVAKNKQHIDKIEEKEDRLVFKILKGYGQYGAEYATYYLPKDIIGTELESLVEFLKNKFKTFSLEN